MFLSIDPGETEGVWMCKTRRQRPPLAELGHIQRSDATHRNKAAGAIHPE